MPYIATSKLVYNTKYYVLYINNNFLTHYKVELDQVVEYMFSRLTRNLSQLKFYFNKQYNKNNNDPLFKQVL